MNARTLCFCLLLGAAVGIAQSPEASLVERNGSQETLIVNGARPLDSAATTLAQQFGIRISVEDPPFAYKGDVKDVTAEISRSWNPSKRVLVPRGGRLEVQFALRSGCVPTLFSRSSP